MCEGTGHQADPLRIRAGVVIPVFPPATPTVVATSPRAIRWLSSFVDDGRDGVLIINGTGRVTSTNDLAAAVVDLGALGSKGLGLGSTGFPDPDVQPSGTAWPLDATLDGPAHDPVARGLPWHGTVLLPFRSGVAHVVDVVILPMGQPGRSTTAATPPKAQPSVAVVVRDLLALVESSYDSPAAAAPRKDAEPVAEDRPLLDLLGQLMIDGRLVELADEFADVSRDETREETPEAPLPPALVLARLDARVRTGQAALSEVHQAYELLGHAAESVPPVLHSWLAAIAAELHLWHGELSGVLVAAAALRPAEFDDSALGAMAQIRLARVVALAELVDGGGESRHDNGALLEREPESTWTVGLTVDRTPLGIVAERFRALGAHEEGALTVVLAAIAVATTQQPDAVQRSGLDVAAAIHTLTSAGARRVRVAVVGEAWIHALSSQANALGATVAAYRASFANAPRWPVLDRMIDLLDAMMPFLPSRADDERASITPSTIAELVRSVRDLRDLELPATGAILLASNLLLDAGAADAASDLLDTTDVTALGVPRLEHQHRWSRRRAAVLQGLEGATDEVRENWRELLDPSAEHAALLLVLRLARDLGRMGQVSLSNELRNAAEQFVDQYGEGDPNVTALLARPHACHQDSKITPAPVPSPEATPVGGTVEALGPDLVVSIDGASLDLTGLQSRMVMFLVLARAPMSVNHYVELLWPGVDAAVGRNRLKANLHNLRRAFGAGAPPLIQRDAVSVRLVAGTYWRVDVWDLLDGAGAGPTGGTGALEFRPMVADRQFAFDDNVAPLRTAVQRRWLTAAHRTIDDPDAPVVEVAERLLDAGLVDFDLIDRLIDRLHERLDVDRHRLLVDALRALGS